jgi:hypothetical protein
MHSGAAALLQGRLVNVARLQPPGNTVRSFHPTARRPSVSAMSGGGGGGGGGSREGSFYESEIVQKESISILKDFESLSGLMGKYPMFDVEGKKLFLEQMESLSERISIFHTRANLSDDPLVKQNLNQVSKQLLFLSTNLASMQEGMKRQISDFRRLLEEEEKIVDLNQLAAFRQQLTKAMPFERMSTVQKSLSMENIMKDPSIMMTLSSNPRALVAVDDIMQNGPFAIENYRDDEELYKTLRKVLEMD